MLRLVTAAAKRETDTIVSSTLASLGWSSDYLHSHGVASDHRHHQAHQMGSSCTHWQLSHGGPTTQHSLLLRWHIMQEKGEPPAHEEGGQ